MNKIFELYGVEMLIYEIVWFGIFFVVVKLKSHAQVHAPGYCINGLCSVFLNPKTVLLNAIPCYLKLGF